MPYRKHEESPVGAANAAIVAAVEESQLARLEAPGRRRRRRALALGGGLVALVAAGGGMALAGVSWSWFAGFAIVAVVLLVTFWLGWTLEPHGDKPPLRHHTGVM